MFNDPILTTALKSYAGCLASEAAEDFLQILLNLMAIILIVDPDFRDNIRGFQGRYQFRSQDDAITVAALFRNNRLFVAEEVMENPHITVLFKDGKALMGTLLAPKPDVLGAMLRQEVSFDGNLNYLYKFAFMAKRLELMARGAR